MIAPKRPKGRTFAATLTQQFVALSLISLTALAANPAATAGEAAKQSTVPVNYDTPGMAAAGLGSSGATHAAGSAQVRANPSLMSLKRQFVIDAAHYWHDDHSRFSQFGAIDSAKNQTYAVGLHYSRLHAESNDATYGQDPRFQRLALGLSTSKSKAFAAGVNVQYVKGEIPAIVSNKALTYGLGISGNFATAFRYGAAVENLKNGTGKELAPQIRRLGLALDSSHGHLGMEYRQRQRVYELEAPLAGNHSLSDGDWERMILINGSLVLAEKYALLGGYGREQGGFGRREASGGIEFRSEKAALGFHYLAPDLDNQPHNYKVVSAKVLLK